MSSWIYIFQLKIFCFIAERNEIHAKFSESILDMQQKSGLKYMVLEKKITAMREELDVKDAQMHEIVKASQSSDRGSIINLLTWKNLIAMAIIVINPKFYYLFRNNRAHSKSIIRQETVGCSKRNQGSKSEDC